MTEEDLQTARRFAEALPAEPFGGPILRVIAELERRGSSIEHQKAAWVTVKAEFERRGGIEKRARDAYRASDATLDERIILRHILGEAS